MPKFLANRWTQIAIVAFAAAAIFIVLQGDTTEDATTTEATATATEQAPAETAPVVNTTTENAEGNITEEAVNNTANIDNINQAADETTNQQQ